MTKIRNYVAKYAAKYNKAVSYTKFTYHRPNKHRETRYAVEEWKEQKGRKCQHQDGDGGWETPEAGCGDCHEQGEGEEGEE